MADSDLSLEDDDEIFFGMPDEEFSADFVLEDFETEEERMNAFDIPSAGPSSAKTKKKKSTPQSARLPCSHCNKTYANERTLKTHLNSVRMKDIASRAPNLVDLLDNLKKMCVEVLNKMKETLSVGELAVKCGEYANKLAVYIVQCDQESSAYKLFDFLANEFNSAFQFTKVVLISSLRDVVTGATNKLLNCPEFRQTLKSLCVSCFECHDTGVLNFFIGNFIMGLSSQVLIFACRQMQNSSQPVDMGPKKRSNDNFSSLKFKGVVFYIAGSVVAGINRRRRTYPSSVHICTFASVMNSNFVEDKEDPSTWCEAEIKDWTQAQDRGGLVYVSKDAFQFFYELVKLIICHEEVDGSVLIDKVISKVASSIEFFCMWDTLVGGQFEEGPSLEWLTAIVEIVCRCVSKGIVKRRINSSLKKPTSNVAHRSKLAR